MGHKTPLSRGRVSDGTLRPPRCQRPVTGMPGSCQVHNAIGLARHMEYCSVMCTVVKCSQALVELFAGHLEFHCMYFALYCISASILDRCRHCRGRWHQEGLGAIAGPGGSQASPPNTEMENLNAEAVYFNTTELGTGAVRIHTFVEM